jgi:hypothetical protein
MFRGPQGHIGALLEKMPIFSTLQLNWDAGPLGEMSGFVSR